VQAEGRVPGLGDDAVRAQFVRQVVCKGHKRIGALGARGQVDRTADAVRVDLEAVAAEAPVLPLEPAQQHAHERKPVGVRTAEAGELSHRVRVAQ